MRGNKNKKTLKQANLPAEAQESSADKCETANAEHSMHDLSSESPKACSLTEISESHDRGKNDGVPNKQKSIARTRYSKKLSIPAWFLTRGPSNRAGRKHAFQAPISFLRQRRNEVPRKTALALCLLKCGEIGNA
jgi:hypothetical protein